jgi:hypothetical protein
MLHTTRRAISALVPVAWSLLVVLGLVLGGLAVLALQR